MLRPVLISLVMAQILAAQPRPNAGVAPVAPGQRPGMGQGQPGARRGGGGQQQARKEYRPDELCTVEGSVRNGATGEALSKANITLFAGGRQAVSYSATTDSSGKFVVRNVEPGQYRISVRRNGYVSSEQSGRRALTPGSTLTLTTAQTLKSVEARLIPHGVVTGRVLDLDGEPMVATSVQLLKHRYTELGQRELVPVNVGQTNDLGEYRVFGLPPGRYFIAAMVNARMGPGFQSQIEPAGIETATTTFYPSTLDASQATPVDVQMGFTVQGADVRVLRARAFAVSGQVIGVPQGRGQGMVTLVARSEGGRAGAVFPLLRGGLNGMWLPGGRFNVSGVPPGSYTVVAESFEGDSRMRGSADVEVNDRGVDNVQVMMQPAFEITGTVRLDGQGSADFSSVVVSLQPRQRGRMAGGVSSSRANEDGRLTLRQAFAGHYEVMVSGLPENHYVQSIRAGEVEALADGARVMAGTQLDVVVSANGGRLSGTVTNDKGDVVGSATVILMAPKAPLLRRLKTATVDQQGQFQMTGIAPGEYFVAALEETEGAEYWEPEFLSRNEKLIQKFSIREGATENKALKIIAAGGQ
jgi:Carboxypeptidase regulatory-like domain